MAEEAPVRNRPPRPESCYRTWQREQNIPIYRGAYVSDLSALAVEPWPRVGQHAAFVSLADQEHDDAYVLEIAPGGNTLPIHHMFEAGFFVVSGVGATTFWQPGGSKQTVEWGIGSVFAPPLNCHYQHFNLDGQKPARIFAVTNAPMVMNLYRNPSFCFDADYVFADRYNGEDRYFSDPGVSIHEQLWKTNFIRDLRSFPLQKQPGQVGHRMAFLLANNQMATHCSSFPPGTYKTGHRHGPGAHLIVLDGQGFSLLWFEGQERVKVEWTTGTVISPRLGEFHQHFNTGPGEARYMAFRLGELDQARTLANELPETVAYEDEDPEIYDLYVKECVAHRATVTLERPVYREAALV